MLLTPDKSRCEKHQKIIVSKDLKVPREHRAINENQMYEVRQYRLDGDVIQQEKCCDFLVINDTLKKAYFIELKGQNIDEAVKQLEAGENKCKSELSGYTFFYRIVASQVRTLKLNSNGYRKFQNKCGSRLICKSSKIEEKLN